MVPALATPLIDARASRVSHTQLLLALILLVAATLRLIHLGHESLWIDEATTILSARASLHDLLPTIKQLENMPPLYLVMMNAWVRVFGDSDFSVRFPPAAFGIASVGMMFLLGRRLTSANHADRFGLIAAFLLAISRYHIAYSQMARAYSFLVFVCLLCCYAFVRLIDNKEKPPRWLMSLYVISGAALLWTQPFSALALISINIIFFVTWISRITHFPLRRWLMIQGIIILLFWPWLNQLFLVMRIGSPWIPMTTITETALKFADSWPLLAILGTLILIGCARGLFTRDWKVLLAALICVPPVVVPILLSTPRHPLFVPRYGILSLIGACLLIAYGVTTVPKIIGNIAVAVVCLFAAPNLVADLRSGANAEYRDDVRPAARLVDQNAAPNDGLRCPDWSQSRVFHVYLNRSDLKVLDYAPANDPSAPQRIWFLLQLPGEVGPGFSGYEVVSRHDFSGVAIVELKRRTPATQI